MHDLPQLQKDIPLDVMYNILSDKYNNGYINNLNSKIESSFDKLTLVCRGQLTF